MAGPTSSVNLRVKLVAYFLMRIWSRVVPEGQIKSRFRCMILGLRSALPKEMFINPGDRVVQVGTPKINTIVRLLKCVGPSGQVIVIEPEQTNFGVLSRYVEDNLISNVTLIQKAAWNEKGQHRLLMSSLPGDNRLANDNILHDNDLRGDGYIADSIVEVDTIDNMMRDIGVDCIDFIEITVNGAELKALQGMTHILSHTERLYTKAFALMKDNREPLNKLMVPFLEERNFSCKIAKPSRSVAEEVWGKRQGDIYAWRIH